MPLRLAWEQLEPALEPRPPWEPLLVWEPELAWELLALVLGRSRQQILPNVFLVRFETREDELHLGAEVDAGAK